VSGTQAIRLASRLLSWQSNERNKLLGQKYPRFQNAHTLKDSGVLGFLLTVSRGLGYNNERFWKLFMSILTVIGVGKSFGVDLLFQGVSFSISAGQKMGLVGRNGSGKTTLLRVLLGQELPDGGRVSLAAGRTLGYLKQEASVHPEHTILEEAESVFAPLRAVEARLRTLEAEMENDPDHLEQLLTEYSAERDRFEAAGGYQFSNDLDSTLLHLGFTPADYGKLVGSCSGGEQTRLALAKIVLSRPDLLVLDEPTNHLDIAAVEWLEGFLKSYEGAVLLVSHDRYFLDAVCDTIGDLDNQTLSVYNGNYSKFWQQKEAALERQRAMFEVQQAEINRLEDLIKRNMGADSTASKIRLKTIGRIDRMDKVDRPVEDRRNVKAKFDAESAGRIGREVLSIQDLSKSFGERVLFRGLSCSIERGQRAGLVGPNGSGKSTLVKMILGLEQADKGMITMGHNARTSYFSQHASDSLDPNRSVVDSLLDVADMTSTEARNHLARFLFTGDDVFKTVSVLSGGEKNKLALARMIVEPCNLLILDEPTNHLDIMSCEALTEMLHDYPGTLLLVSHDRYLLNSVTDHTLALTGDGLIESFEGNYEAWRNTQRDETVWENRASAASTGRGGTSSAVSKPQPAKAAPSLPVMNAREWSKARTKAKEAVVSAEAKVGAIEQRIADVEAELASPMPDVNLMVTRAAEHTRLQDDLMDALGAWELAVSQQEELELGSVQRAGV